MAHFGLRTVTNGYFGKDLAPWHANIVSTDAISAGALGKAIAKACALSGEPVIKVENADFVRHEPYPFIPDLAQKLDLLTRNSTPVDAHSDPQ